MNQPLQLGEIIGTRDLTFVGPDGSIEPVKVQIGAPIPDGTDTWFCPYLIKGASFQKLFRMAGVDSMQALIHTMLIITVELDALARSHNGSFRYLDSADLSFPVQEHLESKS